MAEIFGRHLIEGAAAPPLVILVRLLTALLLGALVAWIYVRTSRRAVIGESFPTTLALLAVLIAMVTQVIGDNVARAFSLVGALSIVRFRTVVRDTKDTAYVIFAVVIGMAVGAQDLWVAVLGIAVIGGAMFLVARSWKSVPREGHNYLLTVRVVPGQSAEQVAGSTMERHLERRQLMSLGTAKQGTTVEYVYEARLRETSSALELVEALNLLEGVQDVRLQHRTLDLE